MTDGHSLGGGMAATFAVQNDLNGYGQNALPVAASSINVPFDTALATWNTSGKTFLDMVVAGDPATLYYTAQIANNSGDQYVGTVTLLQNPNLSSEIDAFTKVGVNVPADLDAGYYALNAHSVATVVSLEQAGGATTSASATAPLSSNLSALSTDFEDVALDAPNGSGNALSTTLTGGTNDPFSTATITLLSSTQTQVTGNLRTGTSWNDILTNNANGSVSNVANGYSGLNLTGTNIWQETDTTTSGGAVSASISGTGDVATLNNAAITLAANAAATVIGAADAIAASAGDTLVATGIGNTVNIAGLGVTVNAASAAISLAANATAGVAGNADSIAAAAGSAVTITGTGNTCSASNATIVLADGAQCTVTGSHDTIYEGSNAILVIDSLSSFDTTMATGNNSAVTDSGASDYDVLQGGSDTATVNGAGAAANLTGNSDTATLTGANEQAGASGTSAYIVLQGNGETDTLTGANDASLATGNNNQIAFTSTATNAQGGSYGANNYISLGGAGDTATLTGAGDSALATATATNAQIVFTSTATNAVGGAYGAGVYINLSGAGDTATLTGSGDSTFSYANNVSVTFTGTASNANAGASGTADSVALQGNNGQATLSGSGDSTNATGNNDTATFTSTAANAQASASGTSDITNFSGASGVASMTGLSDTANLSGANDHATGNGSRQTINMDGALDVGSLTGTYETVDTANAGQTTNLSGSNGTWDTVIGSNGQVNLGNQVQMSLNGNNDNIAGNYDLMKFTGQYNILNASNSVVNDFNTVGDYLAGWYDVYNGGNPNGFYSGPDPIVLNLSGQKVQTTGITNTNAFFDVQNNGQKILTGWATAGEGLLVYDPKNTKTVTSEANMVSSFAQLNGLDSNHDGVLSSKDTAWSQLKVWVDKAGIAKFDSSALVSLDQLGITSINLKATQMNQDSNGNTIVADSSFTLKDGSTGDIAGVTFANAPSITMGVNDSLAAQAQTAFDKRVSASTAGPGSASSAQGSLTATAGNSQGGIAQNGIGSAAADIVTVGPNGGTLTGNGGSDIYVLGAAGTDVVKDTAAHLTGSTVQNFSALDGIDLTDLMFGSNSTLGFSEDASNSFGTLTVSDGAHAASLLLLGQYTAAAFQTVSDGGTGTLVALAGTQNLSGILAASHG